MKEIRRVVKEYINFGETLNEEDLSSLKSHYNKPVNEMITPNSTLVVDFKKDEGKSTLITVISNNLDNSKNYIDNKILRQEFEKGTYSNALKKSLGLFFNNEVNEAFSPYAPDHPMVRQKFKKYQRILRDQKKELYKSIDNNIYIPLNFKFGNVDEVKKMNNYQKNERAKMLKLKEQDPEKFNTLWVCGDYHLATFVSRLERTKYQETLMMREELLKRNQISVEVKDYGLTIAEVMNGLQVANKTNEKYLYKAFVEANINLKAIILIIRNNNLIDENDRLLALKTIQMLTNDPDMRFLSDDIDKYTQIKRLIKKYNLPVHNNWKKD